MSLPTGGKGSPNYGLDAPGVVRNLALVSAAGLTLAILIGLGIVPARVVWHIRPGADLGFGLLGLGLGLGLGCGAAAVAMTWSSRVGKLRDRERLLDAVPWTGDEIVLDVGCGRGLMLVGAARRLSSGQAIGIDLWRGEDLAGNRPDATIANARAEGVETRVRVETADMRKLPFPDRSVDRVVSKAAIHNISDLAGRGEAIREIARVLRPGGAAIIDDIRHLPEYLAAFRSAGCTPVRRLDSPWAGFCWTLLSFGALRPAAWLIRRDV